MWQEAQRLYDFVDRWVTEGADENAAELIRQVGKFKEKIVNVTKNKPKSRSPNDILKAGTSVQLDGLKIDLDQALANEAETISTAFDIHQLDALQIVLDGEMQLVNFSSLPRGLLAVVCYYDYHRFLVLTLQALLRLDPETVGDSVKLFMENTFISVGFFKHLLQVQSTFSVQSEFLRLSQPEINGLGGTRHQLLLRTIIDELLEAVGDCLYSLCGWTGDRTKDFASELYPVLRAFPVAEKLGNGHMAAWSSLVRLTSSEVLTRGNSASPVLTDMIKEIRNETLWSDQSLCGTIQLACAVSLRALAVCPTDHLNLLNVEVDVDRIVDRAVQNHAFKFLRHAVLGSDSFTHNISYIKVVDSLLKKLISHFPAKLMEIERDSEDELQMVEEINAKGQMIAPNLYYATFLGCLSDLYFLVDSSKMSALKKEELVAMSSNYSPKSSIELARFLERSRIVCHPIHAVGYLEFERAVCQTQETASFLFDVFARVPLDQDTYIGWEQFMSTLRIYEQRFRQQPQYPHMGGSQQQAPQIPEIPQHELAGLISWITLARKIAELDPDSAEQLIENRGWSLIDCANGLISSPTPIQFKGALLSLLAALARRENGVLKIWHSLNAYQICRVGENGALYGLQQELEERECTAKRFDASLGMMQLLSELFSHGSVPDYASPYIHYLTKSVISQMGTRSYEDVHQLWDIADNALNAVYALIRHGYTDARAVLQKDHHIQLLVELLNDTPVFRAICSIMLEDCDGYVNPAAGVTVRLSQKTAFSALRLLSLAISRHSQLRTAVRAANSGIIVANIQSMLLTALRNNECMLDVLFLYLDQVNELPHHAYFAANILRELCAVKPSLQKTITELLKLRTRNGTCGMAMSAVSKVLDFSKVEYVIDDIIKSDADATDPIRCRGETARILLEIFCDAVDTDPSTTNICFLLMGFQQNAQGQLFPNAGRRTGFHNIVEVLEQFSLEDPLSAPFSALIEPTFRLLKRLTSIDCAHSVAVLRHLRCTDFVVKIIESGNPLHCMNQFDVEETPTHYSLSRMIIGSILHLAAIEISTLLKSGHIETPKRLYTKLFEAIETGEDEGNSNILFSCLHSNRSLGAIEVDFVALDHFNSHKLQLISENCKSTTSFGTPQYDIKNLHDLLKREIMSTQNENTIVIIVEKEMMKVLEYFTDLNSNLLLRGAIDSLVSGCTALLNVIAVFSPVPFFSLETQLDLLCDAAFSVIEFTSTSTDKTALPLSTTLQRLVKTISLIVKEQHTDESDIRAMMGRILVPLLELMVLPLDRPFQSKVALYESARLCLKTCSPAEKAAERFTSADWLEETVTVDREDVILTAVDRLAHDLNQRIVTDASDMTLDLKIHPLLFLGDLLREDSNGSKKVASFFSKSGMPRYLVDVLAQLDIDWVALSRRDQKAQIQFKAFNSILMVLIRMSLTDPGWNALSQLGVLEVIAHLAVLQNPPKDIFLNPKSIEQKGSPANSYSQAVDLLIHLCLTLCSKPKWKRLSFKALDVVRSLSDLLSQLMRAEVKCGLLSHSADLVHHIWQSDEDAKKPIDSELILTALKKLKDPKQQAIPVEQANRKVDFVAPTLLKNLFPSLRT